MKVSKFSINAKDGVKVRNIITNESEYLKANVTYDIENYYLPDVIQLASNGAYSFNREKREMITQFTASVTLIDNKGKEINGYELDSITKEDIEIATEMEMEKSMEEKVAKEEKKKEIKAKAKEKVKNSKEKKK